MSNIVATGQITLVDLNDAKALSAHISTTSMNTQIFDPDTGVYVPNWATNNLYLVPDLHVTGTSDSIIGQANYVNWYENGTQITSGTNGYLIASSSASDPFALTVSLNKLSDANPQVKYSCEMSWTDPNFPDVPSIITADLEFTRIKNGASGSNTIVGILTNESQIVPTKSDGTGGNFAGAITTMMILNGGVDDSTNWTFSAVVSQTTGVNNVTGSFGASPNLNTYTVTNMTDDTGFVDITASRATYTSITKRFSLSKVKAGVDSKVYYLAFDTTVISKTSNGSYTPGTVRITPTVQTGSGIPSATSARLYIEESVDGGATWRIPVYNADTSVAYTYTPTAQSTALINLIRVTMYVAGGTSSVLDQQKITVISDSVTAVLTNENCTVPTDSAGNVLSGGYVNAVTTMKVYVSGVDDSANWTFSASNSPNSANYTASLGAGASKNILTVTGLVAAQDSASTTITATKTGYPTFTKIFTITKSKAGNDPKVYSLVLNNYIISKVSNGSYNPATVSITAMGQVGSGTPSATANRIVVEESIDGGTTWRTAVYNADASTYTYTPTAQSTALINMARVSLYVAGGTVTLLDQQSIPIISDSVTSILTNENATVPADNSGNVLVGGYTNAVTTMKVYVSGVDDSANWTFSASNSPNSANYTATLGAGSSKNILTVTGLVATQDSASTTITATKTGYATQTKTFTLTKSKTGSDSTAYSLIVDPVIKVSTTGVYTPSNLTIYGKSQTGSGSWNNVTSRFVITEQQPDGTWSADKIPATDTVNTSMPLLYTPTAQSTTAIKAIKVDMYAAGGTATLLDTQTVTLVFDGPAGINTISASVYTPSGDTVKNNTGTIYGQCNLYNGVTQVTSGVTFQWYKQDSTATIANGKGDANGGDGWLKLTATNTGGGTSNYATATLTIPASAIDSMAIFKCVASYQTRIYYNLITVFDDSDPIQLSVAANEGNIFKNGIGTKTVTVTAIRGSAPLDISTGYECRWTLRDQNGNIVSSFVDAGKTYKVGNPLTVQQTDITNQGSLTVELWTTT